MESSQPAEQEIRAQLAQIRQQMRDCRDAGYELDAVEDDVRQLFAEGRVSQLHFDVQLVRLRKAHDRNREQTQVLTYSRKALLYNLRRPQ